VTIATRGFHPFAKHSAPMSHGAIFTRGLLRMRFTFPETPIVYTYSFASFESRLADGSAANHTGVFTPSPLFLNVSGSDTCVRQTLQIPSHRSCRFDARYCTCVTNTKGRLFAGLPLECGSPAAAVRSITRRNFQRAGKRNARFLLRPTYVTSSVKASSVLWRNVRSS